MIGTGPRPRGPRAWRWLATSVVALAALAAVAAPASAHDALLSTDPADGTAVEVAPDAVRLTFSDAVIELGTAVLVTGPDGRPISVGPPTVSGTVVSQPLGPERPAGGYVVEWRVTSADGHPISGQVTFTATSAADPPAVETPSVQNPTQTPTPAPSVVATPAPQTDAAPPADRVAPWAVAAGAGVVALLAAGAVWWVRRGRAG